MDKKLADMLWTARWGLNNKKPDVALTNVTAALVYIGAEKAVEAPEPDRPDNPMPPDYMKGIWEPKFVVVKGTKFVDRGAYKTAGGRFEGLVVHYTVSGRTAQTAKNVLSWLAGKTWGCMVMDEDGIIYIPEGFDIFRDWNHHAGVSKWGSKTSVSNVFAGMEICCWGKNSKVGPFRETKANANMIAGKYQTFTEAQERELTNFILWARTKNPEFKLENVVGHDELRTAAGKHGDKQDPGASLSVTMPAYRAQLVAREKAIKAGKVDDAPAQTPVTSPPTSARIALSWESKSFARAEWSEVLTGLIRENLHVYNGAKDITRIVPNWANLSSDQKVKALGEFFVALCTRESSWDPTEQSVDVGTKSNRDSWSIGLFQMSVRDWQNDPKKGGPGYTFEQLIKPLPGIRLFHRAMILQIENTGKLILKMGEKHYYWAPILEGNKHYALPAILTDMKKAAPFVA